MENKKLTRSNNRMLAGVCAGLADYFGWDVTIVRIIYSFATVFTAFSGIIVYIILWIVMPEKKYRDGYEDRMTGCITDNRRHYAMPSSSTSNINVEKAGIGPLVRLPYPIV